MNIMGDPNQQTRPSVFGYDPIYPKISDCVFPSTSNTYQPIYSSAICNEMSSISHNITINTYPNFSNYDTNLASNNYSFYPNFNRAPYPMTFPINSNIHDSCANFQVPIRCKRKTESPPPTDVKQHITEERMAEHLSKLHISSESVPSHQEEEENSKERRLYMCEEMRKLQTTDCIIPSSLINKLEKPCTALVLWTPPPRIFPILDTDSDSNNNNNNEDEMRDNNTMELDLR